MDSSQPTASAEDAFRHANDPLESIYAEIDSMKELNVTVPVEFAIVLLQAIFTLRTTLGARPDARPPASSKSNIPQTRVFDGEPATRQDFVHTMELYLKLTGNPADTDEHKIDTIVAFFGKTPRAWFRGMAEDDPRVTCDYDHFLQALNTYFGGYDPALKAKHAFNTMPQAGGQATLEYIQAFKLATASLPHRVSEEARVEQCRHSLQPSVIKSLGHLQQFATFAALITAVNHTELFEDDVQYARRAEQQRTSAPSSSSGIQQSGQPRGQPSASSQQPGYPRGQWTQASSPSVKHFNHPAALLVTDRPPNAMDVNNHQWNTSPVGGQTSLAELQDLPDHKLRQNTTAVAAVTPRTRKAHTPPRIGNAGYLAAMTVPPPAPTQTLLSPRKTPEVPRPDNATSQRLQRSPDREGL
ncbi:hypothetical protein RI367_002584 [Sorochytrium milnesiophthora]